jgi:hypothetical protein
MTLTAPPYSHWYMNTQLSSHDCWTLAGLLLAFVLLLFPSWYGQGQRQGDSFLDSQITMQSERKVVRVGEAHLPRFFLEFFIQGWGKALEKSPPSD